MKRRIILGLLIGGAITCSFSAKSVEAQELKLRSEIQIKSLNELDGDQVKPLSTQQPAIKKIIVEQKEFRLRIIFSDGSEESIPAAVSKDIHKPPDEAQWNPVPGKYMVKIPEDLKRRVTFSGWNMNPRPKAGCGFILTPVHARHALKEHPEKKILIHTEPSQRSHLSHRACAVGEDGEYRSLQAVRKVDLFKGAGARTHGCIRIPGVAAQKLFRHLLRQGGTVEVEIKE